MAERFLYEERLNYEPLVPAGRIDNRGKLIADESSWIRMAWDDAHNKALHQTTISETMQTSENASAMVTPIASTPDQSAYRISSIFLEPTLASPNIVDVGRDSPRAGDSRAKILTPKEYGVGELIGSHYRVLDVRRGGMGLVYIVDDVRSVKKGVSLRLALKTFQHKYLWDSEATRRFEREALQWVELGHHPNIVHALVVLEVDAFPYLWLEYVDGESLAERLEHGVPALPEALDLSLQFVRGMGYAHETHGVVHRDIKPANILLTKDGVLKIADFGLSKLRADLMRNTAPLEEHSLSQASASVNQFRTTPGVWVGTPMYMSPEAITDPENVDIRSDIYSFGIVMYELFAGSRPFLGRDVLRRQINGKRSINRVLAEAE